MNRVRNTSSRIHTAENQGEDSENRIVPERRNQNRPLLSLALAPLAILGITCGFSLAQRATAAITCSDKAENRFGHMSIDQAKQAAIQLCSELTRSEVTVTDISRQSAYSWRRHSMVREWNVTCDSSAGQYLVRINADTRRVYAINRMDTVSAPILTEPIFLTKTRAEERALAYLRIVGVPSEGLTQLNFSNQTMQAAGAEDLIPRWNFTYRRSVPGLGERLLKVSINGETGRLEHVWNPVFAL